MRAWFTGMGAPPPKTAPTRRSYQSVPEPPPGGFKVPPRAARPLVAATTNLAKPARTLASPDV